MKSKLLSFLLLIACAVSIGLRPARAQNPAGSSDSNGSAVTAPARQSDASHTAVSPSSTPKSEEAKADAQRDANTAVANDRGTVTAPASGTAHLNPGWLGLLGLLGFFGLLGLIRHRKPRSARNVHTARDSEPSNYRRAA